MKHMFSLCILSTLLACSFSSVQAAGGKNADATVKEFAISVSDAGKADVKDSESFDINKLEKAIQIYLTENKKIADSSTQKFEIEITSLRLRVGAAVFWGGMLSGKDRISADVKLKKLTGELVKEAKINADVGGVVQNPDTAVRAEKLYKEFAEQISDEFLD